MGRRLSFVLAVFSGFMTWVLLGQFEGRSGAEQVSETVDTTSSVEILAVNRDLARGTIITEDVLSWEQRVLDEIPPDVILRSENETENRDRIDEVSGRVVRTDLFAGELLRVGSLVEGSASFMALAVRPGMRAMAIRVSPDVLAGGYILPDDKVDVLHTIRLRDGDREIGQSEVILRNVRVLAVGDEATQRTVFRSSEQQQVLESRSRSRMAIGETVTLELTENEAKVLMAAAESGTLSLALRAIEDHGESEIVSSLDRRTPFEEPDVQEDVQPVERLISLIESGNERTISVTATDNGQD